MSRRLPPATESTPARQASETRCATRSPRRLPPRSPSWLKSRWSRGWRSSRSRMALLERNVLSLAPPAGEPAPDRAPDELAAGTPQPLRGELEELLGADRVLARASDLVRYASDASPYRLFPKAVVMAHATEDIATVLAY